MNNGYVASPHSQPMSQPMSSRVRPWVTPVDDPLERVLDLGGKKAMRIMGIAIGFTLAFHGAAAARAGYIHAEVIRWTLHLDSVIDQRLSQQIDIDTSTPKVEVPHIEEKQPEQPLEKKLAVRQDSPAAAAKAAHILAADPNDDIVDFKDTFIQGENDQTPGGQVTQKGTNDKPVVAAHVASNGTGNGQAAPQIMAVDLSRTAELAGSGEWRCPFPPEADSDQVDEASAIIEVIVGATGKAQSATILQDPGHGFGREARQCALRESYVPALDRSGNAVASSKKFRVKFER